MPFTGQENPVTTQDIKQLTSNMAGSSGEVQVNVFLLYLGVGAGVAVRLPAKLMQKLSCLQVPDLRPDVRVRGCEAVGV